MPEIEALTAQVAVMREALIDLSSKAAAIHNRLGAGRSTRGELRDDLRDVIDKARLAATGELNA